MTRDQITNRIEALEERMKKESSKAVKAKLYHKIIELQNRLIEMRLCELRKLSAEIDADDYEAQKEVDKQLNEFPLRIVNLDGVFETIVIAILSIFPLYLWLISRPRHWLFMALFILCWAFVIIRIVVIVKNNWRK